MGNSESTPPDEGNNFLSRDRDAYQYGEHTVDTGFTSEPPQYSRSSIETNHHRSEPPQHSTSLTGTTHHHRSQPPRPGASAKANYRTHRSTSIADNYSSLEQVIDDLREAGLESSNLILGIDFTKSNEWTGKKSFKRRSLHAIGNTLNPYEQAISIIGRTLTPFDEDNLIPCFGFGDATTHDQYVFSFYPDHRPCNGFEEALSRYKEILPLLHLSGPTSFAPVIDAAVDIVEKSNFQYHVLVIIADGQVTRNPDIAPGRLSPQEQSTINSIVTASEYPLSIILVGVGDGPWDEMKQFDDNIPQRAFDNFQFVNFTEIMSENKDSTKKESAFALAALMELPLQYRAALTLQQTEKYNVGPRRQPLPPPREVIEHDNAIKSRPIIASSEQVESGPSAEQACPICLTNPKDLAFGCGHLTCRDCGATLTSCPLCRQPITTRLRLYS